MCAQTLDGDPPRPGGLDVLAQHLLGLSCSYPYQADDMYVEVCRATPYTNLSRRFVAVRRFTPDASRRRRFGELVSGT